MERYHHANYYIVYGINDYSLARWLLFRGRCWRIEMNRLQTSIVPGWDYVALDFYHDAKPVERVPLTGIERLAATIEAQGTPPCGSLNGGNQCKWWTHCATQKMACKEYKDWQTEVGTGGEKVERARRANKVYAKRVPCRTIYDAIFTEAD